MKRIEPMEMTRRGFIGLTAAALVACGAREPVKAITVHRSASCGCCGGWVDHLRAAGFEVTVDMNEDLQPIADRLGIVDALRSCHTGEIGGYFVEGHVPASDIERLLRERPDARGIAVPGMPIGSPGMEMGERRERFVTYLVSRDGATSVFTVHNG